MLKVSHYKCTVRDAICDANIFEIFMLNEIQSYSKVQHRFMHFIGRFFQTLIQMCRMLNIISVEVNEKIQSIITGNHSMR